MIADDIEIANAVENLLDKQKRKRRSLLEYKTVFFLRFKF